MPRFRYRAVSASGEEIRGEMEMATPEAVVANLQAAGSYPMRVEPADGVRAAMAARATAPSRRRGIGDKEIMVFTRELATLLHAGLPLDRSLHLLAEGRLRARTRDMVLNLLDDLRGGATFAAALDARGAFSRMYVNTVRAGEAGGSLETVLERLADYMERARELRDTVISALIYPLILVVVAILSVVILLTQVVPQFSELFADAGSAMPLPTQIVIAVGGWFTEKWWLLLLIVLGLLVLGKAALGVAAIRLAWDRALLALPLIGDLVRKVEVSRFARTLGTLIGNGVNVLNAIVIVRETLINRHIAGAVDDLSHGLKEGQGLARPLAEARLFPDLAVQMIRVGEETGRLEDMLLKTAEVYDKEVTVTIKRLLALLEPVLILALGLVIAGIIFSVLLAVLSVNELAL